MSKKTKNKNGAKQAATDMDVAAVKSFWRSLDIDEKLKVLYFNDRALAGRVADVQLELRNSDLLCYKLGIRGQDAVRQEVGMDQFALEGEAGGRMVAFFAKPEFAQKEDLFDHLERRLETSFLKGRSVLVRERWLSLFDSSVGSWANFMSQVLKLVELSIFQAYRDSMAAVPMESAPVEEVEESLEVSEELLESLESTQSKGKTAKRRAKRKALQKEALANDKRIEEEDTASSVHGHDTASEVQSQVQPSEDTGSTMCTGDAVSTLSSLLDVGHIGDVESVVGMPAVPEGDSMLNFDWSPEGPPIDATSEEVEASVELEVDWSVGDASRMQTRWSAWLQNGLTGNAAEWHWVTDGPPTVAFLKNTFVETRYETAEEERRRARSVPARFDR